MPGAGVGIRVAEDRKTAAIEIASAEQAPFWLEVTLDELDQLIRALGEARRRMAEGQPPPEPEDWAINTVANTRWCLQAAPPEGALLAFYHLSFGPVGLTLPRDEIAKIVSFLTARFILQPAASGEKH